MTYDNRQTEDLTILSKVKPDPPRIDANSVTYKAGLTNQEIKVNNVLNNSSVKLFKADNTPLNVTNITHGSGFSSVVTVSDALPNGGIKAKIFNFNEQCDVYDARRTWSSCYSNKK